jgi:hypothetical protein
MTAVDGAVDVVADTIFAIYGLGRSAQTSNEAAATSARTPA